MVSSSAQQTTSFTYQGRLTDSGNPANESYDLQFTLWDAASGGTQQPQPAPVTVTKSAVTVTGGIFTVQLDFTVNAFPGADRFLEIGVRPAGGASFTILSPRQQISSTPYAIRTLNAGTADSLSSACVGCVQDAQINQVSGSKVNGTIPVASVPGGNDNYIQNTTSQQSSANFNVSGNGTAGRTLTGNVINATTQYNLGGNRFLSSNLSLANTSLGQNAGPVNTAANNSFFGSKAGAATVSGNANAFFGDNAGGSNATGNSNSFFGSGVGFFNVSGMDNSFFGYQAGIRNTTGGNSYFGSGAGRENITGLLNSFFGYQAGLNNTGSNNTAVGANTSVGANLSNATAIGTGAQVGCSNCLVLGNNANVGIGTSTPTSRVEIAAQDGLAITGFQPFLTFRDTNASNARSRIQGFSGGLTFFPESFFNGSAAMYLQNVTGNLGIGTSTPSARLSVSGAGAFNATGAARFDLYNTTHGDGYLQHVTDDGSWQIATINGAATRMLIDPAGNIRQLNPSVSGLVKAMVYVTMETTPLSIARCYNGLTGSSSGQCGFTLDHFTNGGFTVDFGFPISDRFFSVSPHYCSGCGTPGTKNVGANWEVFTSTSLHIFTFAADSGDTSDRGFTVIVY